MIKLDIFNYLKDHAHDENTFYAGHVTTRGYIASPIDAYDVDRILIFFQRHDLRGPYFGFGHIDLFYDIQKIKEFEYYMNCSCKRVSCGHPIGKIGPFDFFLSPTCKPFEKSGAESTYCLSGSMVPVVETPCDVYPIIFTTRDAYQVYADHVKILDEYSVVNYECAVTAYPT